MINAVCKLQIHRVAWCAEAVTQDVIDDSTAWWYEYSRPQSNCHSRAKLRSTRLFILIFNNLHRVPEKVGCCPKSF